MNTNKDRPQPIAPAPVIKPIIKNGDRRPVVNNTSVLGILTYLVEFVRRSESQSSEPKSLIFDESSHSGTRNSVLYPVGYSESFPTSGGNRLFTISALTEANLVRPGVYDPDYELTYDKILDIARKREESRNTVK